MVAIDAPANFPPSRAYHNLVLQALADEGLPTADPEALRQPLSLSDAAAAAKVVGANRLFALHIAPLSERGALLSLEEVRLDDLWTARRASPLLTDDGEAARVMGRLVRAVIRGEPLALLRHKLLSAERAEVRASAFAAGARALVIREGSRERDREGDRHANASVL